MTLFAVNFATMAQDTVATEEVEATEVVAAVEEVIEAEVVETDAEYVEENIDLG